MNTFFEVLAGVMITAVAIVFCWVLIKLSHNDKHTYESDRNR